jgi:Ni,Fe-hydrogenase maturation factor
VFHKLSEACAGRSDVEFVEAGTDLLRLASELRDRDLILLVDAAQGCDRAITLAEHGTFAASSDQPSAHSLSAVQALELLRLSDETVRSAACYWVLVDEAQLI